jgi:hypothetical protein
MPCYTVAPGPFIVQYAATLMHDLYLEPICSHAFAILRHQVGAVFLGIVRIREEHALVASGFLVCANAAGLNTLLA